MTKEEIISFITRIKKDYPKMEGLTEEEYQVWKDALLEIPKDIVLVRYEEHKNNPEFKNQPPSVKLFMNYKQQDKLQKKYLLKCRICGKYLYYEAMRLHEARHQSVEYIKSRTEKYFNRKLDEKILTELLSINQNEFDKKYNEFLFKLIPRVSGQEKINLLRIKYSYDHPFEKFPVDLEKEYSNLLGGIPNDN